MASINQNGYPDRLPDFLNLGVWLRTVLIVTALSFASVAQTLVIMTAGIGLVEVRGVRALVERVLDPVAVGVRLCHDRSEHQDEEKEPRGAHLRAIRTRVLVCA